MSMHKGCLYLLLTAALLPAQYPKSERDLQAALELARGKARIQSALVDLDGFYQREKNWSKQAEILKQIIDFWTLNSMPDSIILARYTSDLGRALHRAGEYSAAEPYLRSAIVTFNQKGPMYARACVATKRTLVATLREENKSEEADELDALLPPRPKEEKFDQHATLISKHEPEYTDDARAHYVNGSVSLSMAIDETGRPRDVEVVSPLGFGLDENAMKTVEKWRFAPATSNGSPVVSHAMIEVSFRLLSAE